MKFLSFEVAFYLYKSTVWTCMIYCCYIWSGVFDFYLHVLNKLQKFVYTTVGATPAASLDSMAHH